MFSRNGQSVVFSFNLKLVRNLINVKRVGFPAEKGSSCLSALFLGGPSIVKDYHDQW